MKRGNDDVDHNARPVKQNPSPVEPNQNLPVETTMLLKTIQNLPVETIQNLPVETIQSLPVETTENPAETSVKKDWSNIYGILLSKKVVDGRFVVFVDCHKDSIDVTISRPDDSMGRFFHDFPGLQFPKQEDGFAALDLMFTGHIKINRYNGEVYNL